MTLTIVYTNGQHTFMVREELDEVLKRIAAGAAARLTLAGGGEVIVVISSNVVAVTEGAHIVGSESPPAPKPKRR